MSEVVSAVPTTDPIMLAWKKFEASPRYENATKWASLESSNIQGSLWAAFAEGYRAATLRADDLHESVNPASDDERLNRAPGAGAMGAVIEYRDLIRAST